MSRAEQEVLTCLSSLLPEGWIWPSRPEEAPVLTAALTPAAAEIALIEALIEQLFEEVDPRTATLCLPDFERVLGPDPCGRDTATMSLADRRALAHQRWTARGGASIPYFVGLAAKRGVAIAIRENRLTVCGEAQCDDELIADPEQFVWTVDLALLGESFAVVGDAQAGDLLYDITLSDIECDIRRRAPAHTEVVFNYV